MTWKIPGYVAERLIGRGASSEVWLGRSTRTQQLVALKKVAAADAEALRAARTEAVLLAALDHPNLIRIHEVVPAAGAIVLVLDLADGGSLADLLQARGRLTPGEVATAITAAGAALAYAHTQRVVHADVSAGNVLFTSFGLPVLADLGGSRIVGDAAPIHGTAAYVSPEVAAGSIAQASSDVFSLAAVAFHAVTGNVLWPGSSSEEMIEAARGGEIPNLDARLAEVPSELAQLLRRGLQVEAYRRPSAAEFALDMRLCVAMASIELTAGAPRPELWPSPAGRHRRAAPGQALRSEPGRPRFDRPAPVTPDRGQLTHGVRIALAVAPARRRRISRRVMLGVGAAAAVLAVAGSGATWYQSHAAAAAGPSATTTVPAPDFAATLAALDAVRQQAFADRQPDLLEKVYGSAELRVQDAALIERLVPSGCGLIGVRTTYRDVRTVTISADAVTLDASAELAPSTLHCGADASSSAAGQPPTRLVIGLAHTPTGYLIASLHVSG